MRQTLLLFLLVFGFTAQAQVLEVSPNPAAAESHVNLTDFVNYGIKLNSTLSNVSGADASLVWKLRQVSGPSSWTYAVCDANGCFPYGSATNADMNGNIIALDLITGATSNIDVQVRHGGSPGTGRVEIDFAYAHSPNEVIYTAGYDITMSSPVTTADSAVRTTTFKIFPNPANDYFKVITQANIAKVELYNVVGRKVLSYDSNIYHRYNIAHLADGIYLVRLVDNKNLVIRTMRIVKRSARP